MRKFKAAERVSDGMFGTFFLPIFKKQEVSINKNRKLSQHISFLKDFFRTYKNFTDSQIGTIEIMLGKLYEKWNIRDDADFSKLQPEDYPILSDLYELMEEEYRHYDAGKKQRLRLHTIFRMDKLCR